MTWTPDKSSWTQMCYDMLEQFITLNPKAQHIIELKVAMQLQTIWDNIFSDEKVHKSDQSLCNQLQACVKSTIQAF